MSTVKAFAAEAEEERRFDQAQQTFYQARLQIAWVYLPYSALTLTFLPQATACLVLYYGSQLVPSEMSSGDLVSFVFYMQSLFDSFNSIGTVYTALVQAMGSADQIFAWLDRKPEMPPSDPPVTPA